jgi:hypothetical protein
MGYAARIRRTRLDQKIPQASKLYKRKFGLKFPNATSLMSGLCYAHTYVSI